MNKIIIIGNLVRDPENSTTTSGIATSKFTVAVQRKFTNSGGEKETDFLPVVTWRALAENCGKYLGKGSKVAVSGSMQIRTYEVDGQKRYASEIIADEVEFLSKSNNENEQGKTSSNSSGENAKLKPTEDEGLPF